MTKLFITDLWKVAELVVFVVQLLKDSLCVAHLPIKLVFNASNTENLSHFPEFHTLTLSL